MAEAGGSATQAGIFYQNSVAALALADLLDFDPLPARERVVEVRVEAPADVDDIVIRYADDHHQYMNVKLNLTIRSSTWSQVWRSLSAQYAASNFDANDKLTIVIGEPSNDSQVLAELCARAASSLNEQELRSRLTRAQGSALESISRIIESSEITLELLRQTSVRHLREQEIHNELARRRLAGGQAPPPDLLSVLRDIAGGQARRRGLFRAAPLRRKLKLERGIDLAEPPEWGLPSYRAMVSRLSRIQIPGMGVAGPAEELFVWPRAREHDLARRSDFEDEMLALSEMTNETGINLRVFPSEPLDQIIIVAGPGYGKSALLTAIAGYLADGPDVPVLVPLASLAASDTSVMEFLANHISREMDLGVDWRRLAEQGMLVLLLDGLDEVPARMRPSLMKRISTLSARYPRVPWILTVRDPAVVTGLGEARVVELLPLSDEDIERFVEAMRKYVGEIDGFEFVRRLKLYPELDQLARIPLFLSMLLVTTDLSNPQPLTRSDLIEGYLKTLFSPAEHKPVQDPGDHSVALRSIAETLAFEQLERQEIGATEREVREVIRRMVASSAESQALLERLSTYGILRQQSAIRLQFPYPIVQEYLAARHLIERYPNSLEQRIEDALLRPWAQVIQFSLELHPAPGPIIREMLHRPDDAFCTGLRLIGRCIANGTMVDESLRLEVGDRLVEYWIEAPSESRERVGRLLMDGFSTFPSPSLHAAVHHSWLINDGAGDIVSKVGDVDLTLSVLENLMERGCDGLMIYHSLKPALNAVGDAALGAIREKMDPDVLDEDSLISLSSLMLNFTSTSVSRDLALTIARDPRLPAQARMRAFTLAGAPLDEDATNLMLAGLRAEDWDRHYEAASMISAHSNVTEFLDELLRDQTIPLKRRQDIAADIAKILPTPLVRRKFSQACITDHELDKEIRLTLQLFEARFGDRAAFEQLVDGISHSPIVHAATTIALFGHYPNRELAERAATLIQKRSLSSNDIVRIANSVTTGMLHIFEMDFQFGGTLRQAPPHPGLQSWIELLDHWADRHDLNPRDQLDVLAAGTGVGSDWARSRLEAMVFSIENMDAPEWVDGDEMGHSLSDAIREVQRRKPLLPLPFIERLLRSTRYNIATRGIAALKALGNDKALQRLIDFHGSISDWHLKDTASNTLESMAAKQGMMIQRDTHNYRMSNSHNTME